jgi:acyl dehydratase
MSQVLRIERVLTQDDFDAFAAVSGDDNPIHVDEAFSSASKFGRPVAHGVLLVSILAGLVTRLRPGARIVGQQVRFPAPTFAGESVVCEAVLREGDIFDCRVTRADGVVSCDGELTAR